MTFAFRSEAENTEGKNIFENDTLDVTFNIPVRLTTREINYDRLQFEVEYFDVKGKKVSIWPGEAKEIRFRYNRENIRMISKPNSLGLGDNLSNSTNIFLKIEVDGYVKLFYYYNTYNTPNTINPFDATAIGVTSYHTDRYILQKGNGELTKIKGSTFNQAMMEHFNDCPLLMQKIENKIFQKEDMESIVNYYNSQCRRE